MSLYVNSINKKTYFYIDLFLLIWYHDIKINEGIL